MSHSHTSNFPSLEIAKRQALHRCEMSDHLQVVDEYAHEITTTILDLLLRVRPNAETLKQQPYMSSATRYRLLDFAYRVLVRLKLLPFVYFRAIRLFDRYCSKRVVLGDQIRLIISTCLWISAKVHGGNNHFGIEPDISPRKCGPPIKYVSHPGRFRLPRLLELVNLCGSKCLYDVGMFKQMEVHIFSTLLWQVSDPCIDDYLSLSNEAILPLVPMPSQVLEMSRTKEFLGNIALYSHPLVDISNDDLAQVILDFINEVFGLTPSHSNFQVFASYNPSNSPLLCDVDPKRYSSVKRHLVDAILDCQELALYQLSSSGPRYLYQQVCSTYEKSASRISTPSPPEPTDMEPVRRSPGVGLPVLARKQHEKIDRKETVKDCIKDLYEHKQNHEHEYEPPAMVARLVRALGNVTLHTVALLTTNNLLTLVSLLALSQGAYHDLFEFGSARRDLPASELPSPLETKIPCE